MEFLGIGPSFHFLSTVHNNIFKKRLKFYIKIIQKPHDDTVIRTHPSHKKRIPYKKIKITINKKGKAFRKLTENLKTLQFGNVTNPTLKADYNKQKIDSILNNKVKFKKIKQNHHRSPQDRD